MPTSSECRCSRPGDGLDLERRREDRAAARQRRGPARLGDDRREPVVELGLRPDDVHVVGELVPRLRSERRRGGADQQRKTDRGGGAEPAPGVAHQLDPARAGQDADQRGREGDVAQVAGEPGLRHQRDRDHQRERDRPEPEPQPVAGHPGPPERDHRADEHRDHQHRARAPERLHERERGERGRVGVRVARPRRGAQEVAGAEVLGHEPQQSGEDPAADHERPRRAVRPQQPEPVGEQERPQLGPQQPCRDAEQERLVTVSVEVALDRPQAEADEQALGVPAGEVADELLGHDQPERRDHARDPARQPRGQPVGEGEGQQPARPARPRATTRAPRCRP